MAYLDSSGKTLDDYPRPSVAVDVAVLTVDRGSLAVVVVDTDRGPALPGTFLHPGERLADAARRALLEKSGIRGLTFEQLQMFDKPDRDFRGWVVSMAHSAVVNRDRLPADVQLCRVKPNGRPAKRLAFDHSEIVALAVSQLRARYAELPDPGRLLGEYVTVLELRELYEIIYGAAVSKDTFRRNILKALEPTEDTTIAAGGRPARLYRRMAGTSLLTADTAGKLGVRGD